MRWTLPRSQMRKQLHPVTRRSILWGQFPLMPIPCLHISRPIKQTLSLFAGFYMAFISGFMVSGPRLFREAKNLKTALTNAHIVQAKKKEISLQKSWGTFSIPILSVYPSFTPWPSSPKRWGLSPHPPPIYQLLQRPPVLHRSLCINRQCSIYQICNPGAWSSGSQI